MSKYRDWPRREWPAFIAIVVLIVGNLWMYGIGGFDWHPVSPPFIIAVAVFIGGEFLRNSWRGDDQAGE